MTENLLHQLKTPKPLIVSIIRGLSNYYDNIDGADNNQQQGTTKHQITGVRHDELEDNICTINQGIIGWEHFARGWISTSFITTINRHYQRGLNKGNTFTGTGWTKMVAQHILKIHIEAWNARCNDIFGGLETNNKRIVSLHKQSLLMTVEQYYEKAEALPVEFW